MGAPFVLTRGGFVVPGNGLADGWTDEDGIVNAMTDAGETRTARDGRRWTLRPARPTDSRGLAHLFAAVRGEGRWLLTPPSAVSEPSEAFFIGEMIRGGGGLALVAEADGEVIDARPRGDRDAGAFDERRLNGVLEEAGHDCRGDDGHGAQAGGGEDQAVERHARTFPIRTRADRASLAGSG